MLTTTGLVQNTASYLFPSLLMLIAWYSCAAAVRAFTEFLYRFRQKRKVGRELRDLSTPLSKGESGNVSMTLHHYLGGLQSALEESLLIGKQATGSRIAFAFLEALLFSSLAFASFYSAGPLLTRLQEIWWIHIIAPFFFLCFILRARRILLLLPLTFVALLSWEVVAFVASFEKTLEATTLMASIEVKKRFKPKKANDPTRIEIDVSFRPNHSQTMSLPADGKLYFEGRVYRVSTEVLLFGGRNLATIDRIFSDEIRSKDAFVLVDKESIPPLYQWRDQENKTYLLPQKKLFRWIWKEFFRLRKQQYIGSKNPVQTKLLLAAICQPLTPGQRFEIRLRNVGGLECHTMAPKALPPRNSFTNPAPSTQPTINHPNQNPSPR